jgi:nitrite reductase/ring-hydroxylating ferredoxin subunit
MHDAARAITTGASAPVSTPAWWAVAHVDEMAEVGSFIAREVGGSWLIAVRDQPDSIRLFENACPHQGLPICASPGRGKARTFQCPFHGWAFGIDGQYLPTRLPRPLEDWSRHAFKFGRSRSLSEYKARIVGGIVFAALPQAGAPADAQGSAQSLAVHVHPTDVSGLLGRRHLRSMDVSLLRTSRAWRPVYDNLLAAFGTEGVRFVAVNAFVLLRDETEHTICAVIPRGAQGCTVTLVRGLDGDELRSERLLKTTSKNPTR